MKLGIMQPYFFPYIGYFQLMNATDEFIVYDNIKFSRSGWVNRNRILCNGKETFLTIPLRKDSDFLDVRERYISDIWNTERRKILNKIFESYRKAPFVDSIYPVIESCFNFQESNLFLFIYNSIMRVSDCLNIKTSIKVSSAIEIDHNLKAAEKVIALCQAREADIYINPIGGVNLYDRDGFKKEGIDLKFIKTREFTYPQFNNVFIPSLSVIDVLMFNSTEKTREYINGYFDII